MKKIAITIAVLCLLYPPGSWLIGFAIEQRADRLADQETTMVPQLHLVAKSRHGVLTSDDDSSYELGSTLKVSRHYHRGFFTSMDDATVEVSRTALDALPALKAAVSAAGNGDSQQAPFRFSVQTIIHHGPICGWTCFALAGADAHVRFTGPVQAALTRVFGNREPFEIRGRLGFFGGGSSRMSSPAFELASVGQNGHLGWGGIDSSMHYGAQLDWYDFIATAPSLRVESPKGTLEVQGMSFTAHEKRLLRTMYGGDARLEVEHIGVTDLDHVPKVAISNLQLLNQSHTQDRFMTVSYQLGAGAIVTPPLTLSSAHLDLTWKHLDLESLESLTTVMRAAGQETNAPSAPVLRAQAAMAAIKKPFRALLFENPEMVVDRISVSNAQGQGSVTGTVRLLGVSDTDFEAPALFLSKLDVRLDVAIDEPFLASLPAAGATALAQLQPMIDQGYITRANNALRSQVLFRGGKLSLNGKSFNPAALQPAVSQPPGAVR